MSYVKRSCARSTCQRPAAATLSYSYGDRVVWIEHLTAEPHPMVHDMCEQHASSVTAPLGWEVRDLRDPAVAMAEQVAEPLSLSARFDLIGA